MAADRSYLRLSEPATHVFRFPGLHPGPEITAPAAAALADVPSALAATLLDELAAVNLLAEYGEPGRYSMHSLLRAFAAELIADAAAPDLRRAAVHRLYDYYLRSAIAADHSFTTLPTALEADGVPLPPGLEQPAFPDEHAGLDWSAAEQSVTTALISHAAKGFDEHSFDDHAFDDYGWRLAVANSCGLMIRGRFHDAAREGRLALAASRRLGDRAAEGRALFLIGRALAFTGEHFTARYQLERALRIQRALGDRAGQAETHRTLMTCFRDLGDADRAYEHAMEYLAAARDMAHEPSICSAMHFVGSSLLSLGRYQEALDWANRSLSEARRLGRRRSQATYAGAVIRRCYDLRAPAPLFTNLTGYGDTGFGLFGAPGALSASGHPFARIALALGLAAGASGQEIVEALADARGKAGIPPVEVPRSAAPCKENVVLGDGDGVVGSKRILIVASNPAVSEQTGWPIGFWWAELAHPYWEFTQAGYEVDIASPDGGALQADSWSDPRDESGCSAEDLLSLGFLTSPSHAALVADTPALADVAIADYAALVVIGGLGPMYTFVDDARVHGLIAGFYEAGKVAVVLCHGTVALLRTRLSDGNLLVSGKTWTGFANSEKDYADAYVGQRIQPFRIEDEARALPDTNFVVAGRFRPHAVRDGLLITGQQQYSGAAVAGLVIEALGH